MRRADRLFQIILLLRPGRVRTARDLAGQLNISERTLYRDIADLTASGVPIEGEAGVGYRLAPGYHVPPLMFDIEEIQALLFGAEVVRSHGDRNLAAAADRLVAKIDAVIPERLRRTLENSPILVPPQQGLENYSADLVSLREAVNHRNCVELCYHDVQGNESLRTVRPLVLLYWGNTWTLGAWCELRSDFRSFRVDRIVHTKILPQRFAAEAGKNLAAYLRQVEASDWST
jgi:predicted DNA-binding transcriptional regulator YafY